MLFDLHRPLDDVYGESRSRILDDPRKEKQPVEIRETNATPSGPTRRWIQVDEKHISRRLHEFQVYFVRDKSLRESAENCEIIRTRNEGDVQLWNYVQHSNTSIILM